MPKTKPRKAAKPKPPYAGKNLYCCGNHTEPCDKPATWILISEFNVRPLCADHAREYGGFGKDTAAVSWKKIPASYVAAPGKAVVKLSDVIKKMETESFQLANGTDDDHTEECVIDRILKRLRMVNAL